VSTYRVTLEPLNEVFECDEDETVLEAAFRNGLNLVHGCREGRCTACKSFLQEGYVYLKPYSTFALSESEEEEGFTLLCRAVPETDLVVELLTYDPDHIRLDNPVVEGKARVVAIESLTHDIVSLSVEVDEPASFGFKAGQYVDLTVPGTGERRAYSMANLPGSSRLDFVIKRYPGGVFSGLLDGGLSPGDELAFRGPFGMCSLSGTEQLSGCVLVAGGSGMAPMLSLLRQIAAEGSTDYVRFFYGARSQRDIFYTDLVAELGANIADFEFVPVLSNLDEETADHHPWEGEQGFVHEAVERYFADAAAAVAECKAFVAGPQVMVDATCQMLSQRLAVDESKIAFDAFVPPTQD
jgi:propane monooxygenase reductase subunit